MEAVIAKKKIALKNILFPTDFSDASRNAMPWAAAIARRYGAALHVAHVAQAMVYPLGPAEAVGAPYDTFFYAEGLMKKLAANPIFEGADVHTFVVSGQMELALAALIEENQIDWLVLGTHGRSGLHRLLLGSVAEQILRSTKTPILTLGPHILPPPSGDVNLRKILCVVDFSSLSEQTLDFAFSLAQEHQSRLVLLHVVRGVSEVLPEEQAFLRKRFEHLLREMAPPEAELWCDPEFVVESGEDQQHILASAASQGADLIVQSMVPGLSRDAALEVIRHAHCPVLTVHQ